MTIPQKLDMVKSLLCDQKVPLCDDLLLRYIEIAGARIINKAFPYSNEPVEVPEKYEILQCEIAVFLYLKRGAEGETSHSENGVSSSYEDADIPASMLRSVIPHCGVL